MGCDIHVWIEKRQPDGHWKIHAALEDMNVDEEGENPTWEKHWEWVKANYPETENRNYKRFHALANVRSYDVPEGPEPKGWPEDADPALREYGLDNQNLHSHSWYSLLEAAKIWAETEYEWEGGGFYKANPCVMYFQVDPDKENPEDYRVLFAFDN